MIQDKIFFDEKDPTGLSYNTPFTFYGSYQGRLWSKAPGGEIKYYTQNSDLSVYAITGSNQFNGNQAITGSLTVTGGIIGTTATSSYVEYSNVANKPTLVSGSSQVSFNGIVNKPTLVSGSAQVAQFGYAITGSNQFKASQAITGSLVVTQQIVAQTLNVQQVTSSIVYSSGSNIFGNNSSNNHRFTGSLAVTGSLTVAVSSAGTTSIDTIKILNASAGGGNLIIQNTSTTLGKIGVTSEDIGSGTFNDGVFKVQLANDGTLQDTLTITSRGAATFSSSITSTNSIFINGSNDNRLGSGALTLLNYSSYNSSANQSITLGLGLNAAVDNNIAYQYVLGVGGNASGQNLSLTSKRNGISDLTILSVNTAGQITINNLSTGAVYSNSGTLTNAAPLITATGGTIVTTGGFKYHTFTSSGTFQVTAGSGLIEVFVLGGGGAGGGDFSGGSFYAGGGGSGGGLYNPAYYVEVGSYTVVIGGGGVPNTLSNGFGGDGGNSVFGNITALGGGGGSRGNGDSTTTYVGRNGGSGGGGGSSNGVGGTSTQSITNGVAYGNNGAIGQGIGGGGGGLGSQPIPGGFGGIGKYILNQANRIGGGGGAGSFSNLGNNAFDGGGKGGYWNGSNDSNSGGTAGTANTGGGGGGLGYPTGVGGAGGSGIVIVKYKV